MNHQSRRRFLGYFSGIGLSSTLMPGALWAGVHETQDPKITPEMVKADWLSRLLPEKWHYPPISVVFAYKKAIRAPNNRNHPRNNRIQPFSEMQSGCNGESPQQHQRQPQREERGHDNDGDEAHRAEGLALNVGDTQQEADAGVHAEEDSGDEDCSRIQPEPDRRWQPRREDQCGAVTGRQSRYPQLELCRSPRAGTTHPSVRRRRFR